MLPHYLGLRVWGQRDSGRILTMETGLENVRKSLKGW